MYVLSAPPIRHSFWSIFRPKHWILTFASTQTKYLLERKKQKKTSGLSLFHHGHIITSCTRWSGSLNLALNWIYINSTSWRACIGNLPFLAHFGNKPATFLLVPRYLQYLANTRLQHLERIQMFTAHAYSRISKPTIKESAAFSRSYSFLGFAMLEASAVQSFADGLSQVRKTHWIWIWLFCSFQLGATSRMLTWYPQALLLSNLPRPPSISIRVCPLQHAFSALLPSDATIPTHSSTPSAILFWFYFPHLLPSNGCPNQHPATESHNCPDHASLINPRHCRSNPQGSPQGMGRGE